MITVHNSGTDVGAKIEGIVGSIFLPRGGNAPTRDPPAAPKTTPALGPSAALDGKIDWSTHPLPDNWERCVHPTTKKVGSRASEDIAFLGLLSTLK